MLEFSVYQYIIFFLVLLRINLGSLMTELRMKLLSRVMLKVYKAGKYMLLPIPFNVFLEMFERRKSWRGTLSLNSFSFVVIDRPINSLWA